MSGDLTGLCLYMPPIHHVKLIVVAQNEFFNHVPQAQIS